MQRDPCRVDQKLFDSEGTYGEVWRHSDAGRQGQTRRRVTTQGDYTPRPFPKWDQFALACAGEGIVGLQA